MKLAQKTLINRHTDPGEENQHKEKQKEKEGGGKKKVELLKGSPSHMRKLTTVFACGGAEHMYFAYCSVHAFYR